MRIRCQIDLGYLLQNWSVLYIVDKMKIEQHFSYHMRMTYNLLALSMAIALDTNEVDAIER